MPTKSIQPTKVMQASHKAPIHQNSAFSKKVDEAALLSPIHSLVPSEAGEVVCNTVQLSAGMSMQWCTLHCSNAVLHEGTLLPIATLTDHWEEPMLCIYHSANGRFSFADAVEGLDGEEMMFGGKECLITYTQERHALLCMEATKGKVELSTLILSKSLLLELLDSNYAMLLLDGLQVSSAPSAHLHALPPHVTKLLEPPQQSPSPNLPNLPLDSLACLTLQVRVLDYLAALLQMVLHRAEHEKNAATLSERIEHLHSTLMQYEGKIPPLQELAKRYNLSVRTLQTAFVARYGSTIGAYITRYRLEQAHRKLLESDLPMKIISRNLGYSHVNHFITAFSRHFGYSPGSVRKTASPKKGNS